MEPKRGFLEGVNTIELLNRVGESLILTDDELNISWFNECARDLLNTVAPHINLADANSFLGVNLKSFHRADQIRIIEHGPLPYTSTIHLFQTFSAHIVVDRLPESRGYILTWKDVTDYEKELLSGRKLMEELYTPIIGTMLDHTFLAAITGFLSEHRIEHMTEKILSFAGANQAEYMLFDFSEMYSVPDEAVIDKLEQLVQALNLMGTEAICVGLKPDMARQMISRGYGLSIKAFPSFKQGISYVWEKLGYTLVKS
ncbi:STAS domain-containing protein [Metabacillus sp. KIGAM252]|uniref:STAS domain-containing protein n=1 Tax=Metabacillus flavus TaxID=2823519 RepID=A0ABS5LEU3_9BACI|nr:STAS domain-containing protein [Metabacillus flavus]MBS2969236.1 STAS domain-containing protein [Metabacillus flavus]